MQFSTVYSNCNLTSFFLVNFHLRKCNCRNPFCNCASVKSGVPGVGPTRELSSKRANYYCDLTSFLVYFFNCMNPHCKISLAQCKCSYIFCRFLCITHVSSKRAIYYCRFKQCSKQVILVNFQFNIAHLDSETFHVRLT